MVFPDHQPLLVSEVYYIHKHAESFKTVCKLNTWNHDMLAMKCKI